LGFWTAALSALWKNLMLFLTVILFYMLDDLVFVRRNVKSKLESIRVGIPSCPET